jgi:hypothetical protein
MEEYIKKIEKENEYLNKLLRASYWFRGVDKIKEPHLNYIKDHPKCNIIVGWFWFADQGPNVVREIENSLEFDSIKKPLLGSVTYDDKNNWRFFDGGKLGHPLDTFRSYWFAGPLIAPYRDLLEPQSYI